MADNENLRAIEEMRSRYDTGFSFSDKAVIQRLYYTVLGKRVINTGCSDCYRDAFVEIRRELLRTTKQKSMINKNDYTLKAGAIIHPQGTNRFYSLNTVPNEVAEQWLADFPNEISNFEAFPSDWRERVAAVRDGHAVPNKSDNLRQEVERLTKDNTDKAEVIASLSLERDTLRQEIERLTKRLERNTKKKPTTKEPAAAEEQTIDTLHPTE